MIQPLDDQAYDEDPAKSNSELIAPNNSIKSTNILQVVSKKL